MEQSILTHFERTEAFLQAGKPRRAYLEAAAGILAVETKGDMRLETEELRAGGLLYGRMGWLARQYPGSFAVEHCGERAQALLDRLAERTKDPADRALQEKVAAQVLAPPAPLSDEAELEGYLENGTALGYYDIMESMDGLIMVLLPPKAQGDWPTEESVVYYDGGENAVLFKNEEMAVVMDYLHRGVREMVDQSEEILFIQNGPDGGTVEEYLSPVIHTRGMEAVLDGWIDRCRVAVKKEADSGWLSAAAPKPAAAGAEGEETDEETW